jgi:hypothetical protein
MSEETKPAAAPKRPAPKDAHPTSGLGPMITAVEEQMADFLEEEQIHIVLTGKDRIKLISAGVKNYGFIDKAFDIIDENPQFLPAMVTRNEMWSHINELEQLRQLCGVLEEFLHVAEEGMLMKGDVCYREALRVYQSLKALSNNKVPGAEAFYESLHSFFRRRKAIHGDEPAEKEIERDVKRLLEGTADGEVIIKSE